MTILLASQNQGKLLEFQKILNIPDVQLVLPPEVGVPAEFDVPETGATFAENAELKARAFAAQANLPTLADDSGLLVSALGGLPGVHSKRFVEGSDHDRNLAVLEKLANLPDRSASFVTVLCLYFPESQELRFFEGKIEGTIALEEKGTAGFGYDAIFIPEGYEQTFGELGQEVKNRLSHRARAAQALRTYLATR